MFTKFNKLFQKLKNNTLGIKKENKFNLISFIVIILIDIFVLFNVFNGLNFASSTIPTTQEIYPCFSNFKSDYSVESNKLNLIDAPSNQSYSYSNSYSSFNSYTQSNSKFIKYEVNENNKLPYKVAQSCTEFANLYNTLITSNENILTQRKQLKESVATRTNEIEILERQYNSTILEKIANQKQENSINVSTSSDTKLQIDKLKGENDLSNQKILELNSTLLNSESSSKLFKYINETVNQLTSDVNTSLFWYNIYELISQILFLTPLLIISLVWYKLALGRNWQLQTLISWHLFLIFLIPIIIKLLIFMQVGYIFSLIFNIITFIFGGFLVFGTYFLILIIPLVGFFSIKLLQKIIFKKYSFGVTRVQLGRCIDCNRKIRADDKFCPFCASSQYKECQNCGENTYINLEFCKNCGVRDELNFPQPIRNRS